MEIKFSCSDKVIFETFHPKSILDDIPTNFKNFPEDQENVRSCLPIMDYLSSGYIIYNPYEYFVEEKVANFQKGINIVSANLRLENENVNAHFNADHFPWIKKIKKAIFKIHTEWKISTPPGYSCIIMQPFYEMNSSYTLFPSIVDTDKYDNIIFTAGYLNDNVSKHRFFPGDKLLQVIPFKRENWVKKIENEDEPSKIFHYLHSAYKRFFHSKKVYK